ncbi:12288_t:CDS:2, partial [Rhizophagus irregularis]
MSSRNHIQITLFAFFTWQYPAVSNLRAFNVLDAFSGQAISVGLSGCSSRINPSVWIRHTLSLYGSNNSEVVLRPLASRNGAILEYSPLKRLPG